MKKIQEYSLFPAIKIAVFFTTLGILYLLFSDWIIMQFVKDTAHTEKLHQLQSIKGTVFILLTSILIFYLAYNEINQKQNYIKQLEDQKERLSHLKEEESKVQRDLNLIFNNSEELIVVVNYEGNIIKANPAWKDKLGWTDEELMSRPWIDFIHPDDVEKSLKRNELLIKGEASLSFVHRFKKKGDGYCYLSWNVIPLNDENLVFGIGRDITLQTLAEKELGETKNLLEKTINNLNEAVFVINPENRSVILANEVASELFGYNRKELIGMNTADLHVNNEMYKEFAEKFDPELNQRGIFQTEYKMKRKNGEVFETENTVTAIQDKKGWRQGVVSVVRDITARKNAERKLEEYQEKLKQLTIELSLSEEKQRKDIASNIHDHLSQSLVVAKMKLKDLLSKTEGNDVRERIENIYHLITETLNNSRKITYDLSPPVLYELGIIETMHWLTEKIARENNIRTSFHSEFDEIKLPDSELILLFRIIQELIFNSVKHANAHKISINIYKATQGMHIVIEDDGKGFQTSELSDNEKRTGFGIFAVKERIKNLSGTFSIHSAPGKGCRSEIYLPLNKTST
ncbi:MAG: PAS domain-containing sensor histidine kinase [Bacteroidota bacterium]